MIFAGRTRWTSHDRAPFKYVGFGAMHVTKPYIYMGLVTPMAPTLQMLLNPVNDPQISKMLFVIIPSSFCKIGAPPRREAHC